MILYLLYLLYAPIQMQYYRLIILSQFVFLSVDDESFFCLRLCRSHRAGCGMPLKSESAGGNPSGPAVLFTPKTETRSHSACAVFCSVSTEPFGTPCLEDHDLYPKLQWLPCSNGALASCKTYGASKFFIFIEKYAVPLWTTR